MALKSIEEEWNGFSAMVFRNFTPSKTQREEMKKAFFAGAWALFTALEYIGTDAVTEDQGEAYLEARRAECLAFKNQILGEYALRN